MTAPTTLTGLSRAIRAVEDADDPMAEGRALLPAMDAILTARIAAETAASLWLQLARLATGDSVTIMEDPADRAGARTACLAALAPPKRGRPSIVDTRIVVGLPTELLADVDAAAAEAGTTRAAEIRRRLAALGQLRGLAAPLEDRS